MLMHLPQADAVLLAQLSSPAAASRGGLLVHDAARLAASAACGAVQLVPTVQAVLFGTSAGLDANKPPPPAATAAESTAAQSRVITTLKEQLSSAAQRQQQQEQSKRAAAAAKVAQQAAVKLVAQLKQEQQTEQLRRHQRQRPAPPPPPPHSSRLAGLSQQLAAQQQQAGQAARAQQVHKQVHQKLQQLQQQQQQQQSQRQGQQQPSQLTATTSEQRPKQHQQQWRPAPPAARPPPLNDPADLLEQHTAKLAASLGRASEFKAALQGEGRPLMRRPDAAAEQQQEQAPRHSTNQQQQATAQHEQAQQHAPQEEQQQQLAEQVQQQQQLGSSCLPLLLKTLMQLSHPAAASASSMWAPASAAARGGDDAAALHPDSCSDSSSSDWWCAAALSDGEDSEEDSEGACLWDSDARAGCLAAYSPWQDYDRRDVGWGGCAGFLGVWPTTADLAWVDPRQEEAWLEATAAAERADAEQERQQWHARWQLLNVLAELLQQRLNEQQQHPHAAAAPLLALHEPAEQHLPAAADGAVPAADDDSVPGDGASWQADSSALLLVEAEALGGAAAAAAPDFAAGGSEAWGTAAAAAVEHGQDEAPTSAAGVQSSGSAEDDAMWSTTLLFDSDADDTNDAAQQLLEPAWMTDADAVEEAGCGVISGQLADALLAGSISPAHAAAADAAASAAAAGLRRVQWLQADRQRQQVPLSHVRLLTAMQHATLQHEASSSSSGSVSEQPFAWMFASASTAAGPASTSSTRSGLQYVLDGVAPATTQEAWPQPPEQAQGQQQAAELLQQQQQQQSSKAQQQQHAETGSSTIRAGAGDAAGLTLSTLWRAFLESWGVAAAASTATTSASSSRAATPGDGSTAVRAEGRPAATQATTAAAEAQPLEPLQPAFQLVQPQHPIHSPTDLGVLARVTRMSRGTHIEPLLWSVVLQEHTVLSQRGELVAAAGPGPQQQQHRRPLSRPFNPDAGRAAAAAAATAAEAKRQQAAYAASKLVSSPGSSLGDVCMSAVVASFLAVRQAGQLLVAPVGAAVAQAGAATASAAAAAPAEAVAGMGLAGSSGDGTAATALAAEPPFKPGWVASSAHWSGALFAPTQPPPPQLQQQQEGLPWAQQLQQSRRQQWRQHLEQQAAAAAAQAATRMQASAGLTHVGAAVDAAPNVASLQQLHNSYGYLFDCHPALAAAFVQRARALWDAAVPAATAHATRADERVPQRSGSAAAAAAGQVRHVDLAATLKDMQEQLAAAQSGEDAAPRVVAPAPLLPEADVAAQLYQVLVGWYTTDRRAPYSLLDALLQQEARNGESSSSSGARSSGAASSRAGTSAVQLAADPDRGQALLNLLWCGVSQRGRALPATASLLPLLQQLQETQLRGEPLSSRVWVCRLLLSQAAALQAWPAQEQHAAFQLMERLVAAMEPAGLLQILAVLKQQQHLASVRSSGVVQQLTRSVLSRLAACDTTTPQLASALSGGSSILQLATLARDACLGAASLVHQAAASGHMLPGHEHLSSRLHSRLDKQLLAPQASSYRTFLQGQHTDYLQQVSAWPQAAAATPAVAAELRAAVAAGKLQRTVRMLKHALEARQQQQEQQAGLPASQLAALLPLLAWSQPFLTYEQARDAQAVAAVVGGDAHKLQQGAAAMQGLAAAVVNALTARQQQQLGFNMPLQQLPPMQVIAAVWGVKHAHLWSSSVQLRDALLASSPPPLRSWPIAELHLLLETWLREPSSLDRRQPGSSTDAAGGAKWAALLSQPAWDGAAAAAAASMHSLAQRAVRLARDSDTSGGSSARAGQLSKQEAHAVRHQLHAASSIAHLLYLQGQYHPALQDALGQVLVSTAAASERLGSRLRLSPTTFTRIAASLANFGGCSPEAAAALRLWAGVNAPRTDASRLPRLMWSFAVLAERDPELWLGLQRALRDKLSSKGQPSQQQQQQRQRQGQQLEAAAGGDEEEDEDD
jgi:hypothetical protein